MKKNINFFFVVCTEIFSVFWILFFCQNSFEFCIFVLFFLPVSSFFFSFLTLFDAKFNINLPETSIMTLLSRWNIISLSVFLKCFILNTNLKFYFLSQQSLLNRFSPGFRNQQIFIFSADFFFYFFSIFTFHSGTFPKVSLNKKVPQKL